MQTFGVLLVALGVAGLLYEALRIVWSELRRHGYEQELDAWAEDVREW